MVGRRLRLYIFVQCCIYLSITTGKYLIPAGCTVVPLIFATHRNPKIFPEPLVFKPERFFPDEAIGRHPYAYYIPFSAGPHKYRYSPIHTAIYLPIKCIFLNWFNIILFLLLFISKVNDLLCSKAKLCCLLFFVVSNSTFHRPPSHRSSLTKLY